MQVYEQTACAFFDYHMSLRIARATAPPLRPYLARAARCAAATRLRGAVAATAACGVRCANSDFNATRLVRHVVDALKKLNNNIIKLVEYSVI
jgi:hypothetical protein